MVDNSDKITVINSTTLCGPHRYMVEKAQKMKEAFKDVEIRMLDLGAAFVTQGGPQCVAIQYIEK